MAKIYFEITISFLVIYSVTAENTGKCSQLDPCHCEINKRTMISLNLLQSQLPLFDTEERSIESFSKTTNTSSTSTTVLKSVTYFYVGCHNEELKKNKLNATSLEKGSLFKYVSTWTVNSTHITNGTIKQNATITNTTTVIGHAEHIHFDNVADFPNGYVIAYTDNKTTTPTIRLVCTNYDKSELKILSSDQDALIIYSSYVCPQTKDPGTSTSSIFLIIFTVIVLCYLIGGGLLLYFVRGARGVEVIPNIDFWRNLPGLVKDGIIFLLSGCKHTAVSTAESYDRI